MQQTRLCAGRRVSTRSRPAVTTRCRRLRSRRGRGIGCRGGNLRRSGLRHRHQMPPVGAKSTIFSILQHWPGSCIARHASRQQGEWHVIHSVVGQSERWAQLTALQPPPAAQSGQGSGPGFSNAGTTPADPTVVNPIAGSTASPLSSNMSFMLMMFGGGLASATGSGAAGGTGLTSGSGSTPRHQMVHPIYRAEPAPRRSWQISNH